MNTNSNIDRGFPVKGTLVQHPLVLIAASETSRGVVMKILEDIKYQEEECVLRAFDKSRIPHVQNAGTDRDDESENWNWPGCDADPELQKQHNIGPRDLIYAYTVTVADIMSHHYTLESEGEHSALAVYRGSALRRVTEVEHWFKEDPKDALIAIITERDLLEVPPAFNEYDLAECASLIEMDRIELGEMLKEYLDNPKWNNSLGIVLNGNLVHRKWKGNEDALKVEYLPSSSTDRQPESMGGYPLTFLIDNDALSTRQLDIEIHNAVFKQVARTRAAFSADEMPNLSNAKEMNTSHFYTKVPNARTYNIPFHSVNSIFILNTRSEGINSIYRQLRKRGFKYVYGYNSPLK